MKTYIHFFCLFLLMSVFLTSDIQAQAISPDKMINHIRDKGESLAFTIPGWFVRIAGNFADNGMEEYEKEMVQELTDHIKKLRFVVSQTIPTDYDSKFKEMKNYLVQNKYEPLIEVREEENKVHIWGLFEGDNIKNLIISVFEMSEESTVLLNIKSNIDLSKLQDMQFFKELAKQQEVENETRLIHY